MENASNLPPGEALVSLLKKITLGYLIQTESGRAQIKSSQIKLCSDEKVRRRAAEERGLKTVTFSEGVEGISAL